MPGTDLAPRQVFRYRAMFVAAAPRERRRLERQAARLAS
jgi:hypothetical protein